MESKVKNAEKKIGLVTVVGDLHGNTPPLLLKKIDALIAQGMVNIILDFSEIEFISSSGIGVIAMSSKNISKRGGKILVVCNQKMVLSLFDITNLNKIITVYKTMRQLESDIFK